jgi:uncharacterized coiled-coil protein SlyX
MKTVLEMGSRKTKSGRRYVKMALHTIHQNDEDVQDNGLHWVKKYVLNNIDTAINMPICVEFTDDSKTVPLGHGYTDQIEDENGNPMPVFENSEVVGVIEKAQIETITVNDSEVEVLAGEGYLFDQRYPNFVKWLKSNMETNTIKSSIELVGTEENNNQIVYDGEVTPEHRTPMVYSYSGTAILSVKEADENAVVLEAASLNKFNDKESEVNVMDEKTLGLIADAVRGAVTETNAKNAEYEAKITELNQTIADKDSKIAELNASVQEIQVALDTVRAEIEQKGKELDAAWEEKRALEIALGEAKAKERLGELNSAIAGFTEEQKNFAKDEIEKFNADPVNVEINTVIDAIYRGIGKQSVEKKDEPVVEINSSADIYGEVFTAKSTISNANEGSIY